MKQVTLSEALKVADRMTERHPELEPSLNELKAMLHHAMCRLGDMIADTLNIQVRTPYYASDDNGDGSSFYGPAVCMMPAFRGQLEPEELKDIDDPGTWGDNE